ncbi:MAG: response regulator [Rhodospirillales bacterium]|nr:response regulator [Rhodospirillales bacterium]
MSPYDLSKLSILLLESSFLVRNLLIDVFDSLGVASVQSTADPEVAFDLFKAAPVDIVISDWSLDLDGMAFLRRLRTDPESPNPFVPVIICTAKSEMRDVCEARDMGMTEYLTKPVSANHIYSRIVSLIEHDRQFIKVGDFFGPDRRRHVGDPSEGKERRRAFSA